MLICERCSQEIHRGDEVEFIGPEPSEEQRIFTDDDVIVVHANCPS